MKKLNSKHNEAISQIQRAILNIAPDDASIRLAAAMLACQRRDMRYDQYDIIVSVADRFQNAIEHTIGSPVSNQPSKLRQPVGVHNCYGIVLNGEGAKYVGIVQTSDGTTYSVTVG